MTEPSQPSTVSPPPAPQAPREQVDPRVHLHALAEALIKTHNRRLIAEYLRLRHTQR